MNIPLTYSDSTEIKIPPNVQYAIGVDGINTAIIPSGYRPQVVYRIGDGTTHSEGWENIEGNKYLDFYLPAYINMTDLDLNDISNYVYKDSVTGYASLPSGTTAQRPDSPMNGYIRFNTDLQHTETYRELTSTWGTIGSSQFLGTADTKAVQYMAQSTNEDLVVPDGTNAFSVGEVTLEDGATITVPDGSTYKVI